MNKTVIAIIDSGIDKSFITNNIKSVIKLTEEEYQDLSGHGTMCFNFINKYCFESEFIIIKILDRFGTCKSDILIQAFEMLLNLEVNVIHLSAAVTVNVRKEIKDRLLVICKQLNFQNKIIVCSQANGRQDPVIPAGFPLVIGVEGTHMNSIKEYYFDNERTIQGLADSTPILLPSGGGRIDFFSGNSKAAAIITIEIVKYMEKDSSYTYQKVLNALECNRLHNSWDYGVIQVKNNSYIESCEKYMDNLLKQSIVNKKRLNRLKLEFALFFFKKPRFVHSFFIKKEYKKTKKNFSYMKDISRFVSYYTLKYSIHINMDEISIFDFINVYSLYNILYKTR